MQIVAHVSSTQRCMALQGAPVAAAGLAMPQHHQCIINYV
jgi:hypothetical protein